MPDIRPARCSKYYFLCTYVYVIFIFSFATLVIFCTLRFFNFSFFGLDFCRKWITFSFTSMTVCMTMFDWNKLYKQMKQQQQTILYWYTWTNYQYLNLLIYEIWKKKYSYKLAWNGWPVYQYLKKENRFNHTKLIFTEKLSKMLVFITLNIWFCFNRFWQHFFLSHNVFHTLRMIEQRRPLPMPKLLYIGILQSRKQHATNLMSNKNSLFHFFLNIQ